MIWPTILPYMNTFCHMVSEELHSQDLTMLHNVYNSQSPYKFCWIKMAAQQVHLHVTTNNPTKYEQIPSYSFRGVAFTKRHRLTETITMSLHHGAAGDKKGFLFSVDTLNENKTYSWYTVKVGTKHQPINQSLTFDFIELLFYLLPALGNKLCSIHDNHGI